jgi:hypothetical protein
MENCQGLRFKKVQGRDLPYQHKNTRFHLRTGEDSDPVCVEYLYGTADYRTQILDVSAHVESKDGERITEST